MAGRPEKRKGEKKRRDPEGNMSVSEHLRELRSRVIVCLAVMAALFLLALSQASRLVTFLTSFGEQYGYRFVYISPQELLLEYFSVAFVCAVCLSLPVILYEVWEFAEPGLKKKEKLGLGLVLGFGIVFAALGVFFAFRVMMPFMLRFLFTLSGGTGIEASISVQNYLSFVLLIFMIFAAVFELPVAACALTAIGLLRVEWMKKGRRVIIVLVFVIAAVITPPDVTSQIMVALPMLVLFEVSIVLCSLVEKIRDKGNRTESSRDPDGE